MLSFSLESIKVKRAKYLNETYLCFDIACFIYGFGLGKKPKFSTPGSLIYKITEKTPITWDCFES
jgi:hypothetical protein